jgi:hypothetical protein
MSKTRFVLANTFQASSLFNGTIPRGTLLRRRRQMSVFRPRRRRPCTWTGSSRGELTQDITGPAAHIEDASRRRYPAEGKLHHAVGNLLVQLSVPTRLIRRGTFVERLYIAVIWHTASLSCRAALVPAGLQRAVPSGRWVGAAADPSSSSCRKATRQTRA